MTGRDLVSASLRLIGALAPGESLAASEATDGLAAINRMIDSWSNESLLIYSSVRDQFTLTPGTASYTFGTGGTFNSARPMHIEQALLRVASASPALEYQVRILSLSEYASIYQKGMTSELVTDLYYEPTYPLGTVNLYPTPSIANSLVIYSLKPLTQIATLDTALSLPQGYEEALVYNGALRLGNEYGRTPNELVLKIATDTKAALKRNNHKSSYLRVDSALVKSTKFNMITGDNR